MGGNVLDRFRLDGRTALVVGTGPGIGSHVARAFASAGANVIASARSRERVEQLAAEIRSSGASAIGVAADIGRDEDRERLVAAASREFGPVHILFQNATAGPVPLETDGLSVDLEIWRSAFEINVLAPFDLVRQLHPGMKEAKYGSIITVLSCASFTPILPQIAYGSTKAALHMMTRYLAKIGGADVRANCICPGSMSPDGVVNPLFAAHLSANAIARTGFADEVVGAALLLASPASSYTTGQVIFCEGGRVNTIS